jgi:hypothetical protein
VFANLPTLLPRHSCFITVHQIVTVHPHLFPPGGLNYRSHTNTGRTVTKERKLTVTKERKLAVPQLFRPWFTLPHNVCCIGPYSAGVVGECV